MHRRELATPPPEATTRTRLLSAPFVVAVGVLSLAAFGVGPWVLSGSPGQVKEPVPLRKPLGEFNKKDLGPYEFLTRATFGAAMIESLGTDEFMSWYFRDTSVTDRRSPLRYIYLHVPYYTGGRDLVPHTPDNCMHASGYRLKEGDNVELPIESLGRKIPVRVVTFEKSSIHENDRPTVIYTFHCNGDFTETRSGVRWRINSLSERYAYFCKIEVSFGSPESIPRNPTREESMEAAAKFLSYILPRLIDEHLPDWAAVKQGEALVTAEGASASDS